MNIAGSSISCIPAFESAFQTHTNKCSDSPFYRSLTAIRGKRSDSGQGSNWTRPTARHRDGPGKQKEANFVRRKTLALVALALAITSVTLATTAQASKGKSKAN